MSKMSIKMEGFEELEEKVQQMSSTRFDAIVKKSLTGMFDRAKGRDPVQGGTPVDSGQLRLSAKVDFKGAQSMELALNDTGGLEVLMGGGNTSSSFSGEMGYVSDYAPHVEYGHRTKDGGWVSGQRFLENNLNTQRPIYYQDLLNALKRG